MSTYRKALLAALAAGLSFLAPVLDDGLSTGEAVGALAAAVVAGTAVYRVPNATTGGPA